MSFVVPNIILPQNAKRPTVPEIRQIFPSAIAVGLILPEIGQGLHIEFGKCANLFNELKLSPNAPVFFSRELCDLTQAFGFINFKNCYVPQLEKPTGLSHGRDDHGYFLQDPFHRDRLANSVEFLTVIHRQKTEGKEFDAGRPEPTYYALEEDIRSGIEELPTDGLSREVIDALTEMLNPDYRFNLYNEAEMPARLTVQYEYPDFVTDVFHNIPEERKFVKSWLAGVWDVVAHANQSGQFLHARATGRKLPQNELASNPLGGLEIYRG